MDELIEDVPRQLVDAETQHEEEVIQAMDVDMNTKLLDILEYVRQNNETELPNEYRNTVRENITPLSSLL